jgi:hypothetical protein
LDNDSFFDSDYAQLVLPRTHWLVIVRAIMVVMNDKKKM